MSPGTFIITLLTLAVLPDAALTPMRLVGGPATVIAADTLVVADERVRLEAIDAPEADQTCRRADTRYACGAEAMQALRARVQGGIVMCRISGQDAAGGLVGVCRLADRTDLAEWLVLRGYALADRRYSAQYVVQEDHARQERAGLWAGQFVAPWDWRAGQRLDERQDASTGRE